MPSYNQDMKATSGNVGRGKEKDDMGNKGRKGKGPKPMKGSGKARRESAKQERKNLVTENPVVNRSNDSGFDYKQSDKKLKSRYKKGSDAKSAVKKSNMHHAVSNMVKSAGKAMISRFQGSTKPLGNKTAMNAMMRQTIQKGLSARLGEEIAKVPTSFTPSKRDMELKEAHLGKMPPQQSADPAKMSYKKAGGPKPQKPKSKSVKPKGKPKYTKSETVEAEKVSKRGKRKIKAKF